jgi:hypothetical protein
MNGQGRAALALAGRGLPVLPLWWTDASGQCACGKPPGACKPGKHPEGRLVPHGCKNATLDPRTIKSWWRREPDCNIGIATGGAMRLLVIDIDPDAGGEANWTELEARYSALGPTVEVITPRGGRHLYLIVPEGRPLPTNPRLATGIDTRCQGGYVVAPPSRIGARPYCWSVDSADRIAMAPEWILERLARAGGNGKAAAPEEWLRLITRGVAEGERNQTIARIAGMLFRRLSEPVIAAELIACWNLVRCKPPLGPEELKTTLDSIATREMQRRGLKS